MISQLFRSRQVSCVLRYPGARVFIVLTGNQSAERATVQVMQILADFRSVKRRTIEQRRAVCSCLLEEDEE